MSPFPLLTFTLLCLLSTLITASPPLVSVLETFPVRYPTRTDRVCSKTEAVSIMNANLDFYFSTFQRDLSRDSTEVLVLPEDGLYGDEFSPTKNITWDLFVNFQIVLPQYGDEGKVNLCPTSATFNEVHPTLSKIACEAKKQGIWIVVNLADFQDNHRYNTVLVVDPEGYFQAKYHKRNLFPDDLALFSPGEARIQTFNVEDQHIGLMICFDIFFSEPARQLIQQERVDSIVFSTYWVNTGTVPYISAVNMQQAFSRAYKVPLFASNMNVGFVDSGSGIYDAGRLVAYTFNTKRGEKITKVLRSDGKVYTTTNGGNVMDGNDVLSIFPRSQKHRDSSSSPEILTLEPFVASPGFSRHFEYKNDNLDNLHCELNVTVSQSSTGSNEVFAFVAYTGNFFEPLPVQLCGMIRCASMHECFTDKFELSSHTSFETFDLVVDFDGERNISTPAFPIISTDDAQLLDVDVFETDCLNNMHLNKPGTILLNAFLFKSFA